MFKKDIPYNDLPELSTLELRDVKGLTRLAEDTRVAIEILNYAVNTLPNPDILLDTLAYQEARVSSNIENIVTTNDDLYRGVVFDSFTKEAKEVSDYKDGLFVGYDALIEKRLLSPSDITNINERVNNKQHGIRTNLAGFSDMTHIASRLSNGDVNILYTPPHGKELIQKLIIEMLDYIYDDDANIYHPLIKIALAHYQFESIHPFRDGNGRTGRILNVLLLCQKKYLDHPILYASSYIIKNKNRYYDLLNKAHETERYDELVDFMLKSFKETSKDTLHIVEKIKCYLEEYKRDDFLKNFRVNSGNREVLCKMIDRLFERAYVRINDLVEVVGLHRQTAAVYLDKLTDMGILEKHKVGRENLYKNVKLFELFDEVNNG